MKIIRYTLNVRLSRNYNIALLADLHSKVDRKILPALWGNKPSMICIAGDLANTSLEKAPNIVCFLNSCVEIAPTYFSLGNHDFLMTKKDLEQLNKMGVHVLNDTFTQFDEEIVIGGMTSYFYHKCEKYDPKIPMKLFPNIRWLDAFEAQDKYKILLDHHPDNYDPYTANRKIDLILSGHAHGGQIRLAGRGIYGRSQGFLPKYDGGIFDEKLIVSRGLSNTMPIPRLWNPTELVFVELRRKNR